MPRQRDLLLIAMTLALAGVLMFGCGGKEKGGESRPTTEKEPGSADFPAKGPSQPFTVNEKGTMNVTNDQAYNIQVQKESGEPLFVMAMKKSTVIDPSVDFAVQTFQVEVPEEHASRYVTVGQYALEMHVVGETGYGFALRPALKIHFTDKEIQSAKQNGASLDTLKGNLIVLYKEQRSPRWVPQTSVSVNEEAKTVTVSNVAGAGAWRLVAKKGP